MLFVAKKNSLEEFIGFLPVSCRLVFKRIDFRWKPGFFAPDFSIKLFKISNKRGPPKKIPPAVTISHTRRQIDESDFCIFTAPIKRSFVAKKGKRTLRLTLSEDDRSRKKKFDVTEIILRQIFPPFWWKNKLFLKPAASNEWPELVFGRRFRVVIVAPPLPCHTHPSLRGLDFPANQMKWIAATFFRTIVRTIRPANELSVGFLLIKKKKGARACVCMCVWLCACVRACSRARGALSFKVLTIWRIFPPISFSTAWLALGTFSRLYRRHFYQYLVVWTSACLVECAPNNLSICSYCNNYLSPAHSKPVPTQTLHQICCQLPIV